MDDQIKIRIKPPHDRIDDVNDQTDIKFIKQKEFNANIVKRWEELEDKILKNTNDIYAMKLWKQEAVARFGQGIENRTKAFEKIAKLEDFVENYDGKHRVNRDYSFQRRIEFLEKRDKKHKTRIDTLEKQVSILKDLLDRYFTLEINEIEKSHGKRK